MSANLNEILTSGKIKILSLDCFDTLLWRKVATPRDVFYDLQSRPTFKSLGITAKQRVEAERIARSIHSFGRGYSDIPLKEVFRLGLPSLNEHQVEDLMEDELTTEIETCYGFPFILELILYAKKLGLQVIIVSNTYLDEKQLRRLLSATIPAEVYAAIDKIFCSCEFGISKHEGLFQHILSKLSVAADEILHLGDDEANDFVAPNKAGIEAMHFKLLSNCIIELQRLRVIAATIADPNIRKERALASPYHGIFASSGISSDDPGRFIGYTHLGPIMYAFAKFICDDLDTMHAAAKHPKVIFLMRDGYLLSLACEAFAGKSVGTTVYLSRFSTIAATFRSKDDVIRYLAENYKSWDLVVHCKQLLLPQIIVDEISKIDNIEKTVTQFILQDKIVKIIIENSIAYAARLKRYLKNEIGLQPGDDLVFVDVGYNASAQRLLTPILQQEMGVREVIGRYLITNDYPEWQFSRRGLIDPSWCEIRTIDLLVANIFLFEELCCNGGNSVVDYDNEGQPIYFESKPDADQIAKINIMQTECLRFINDAKVFFKAAGDIPKLQALRDATLAELVRSIYLSTDTEIKYFKNFQHNLNKATSLMSDIFIDPDLQVSLLRKRGFWFDKQHSHAIRAATDLEHVLMLMIYRRFNFDLISSDFSLRKEVLTVKFMQYGKSSQRSIIAKPTHGDYFSLTIYPVKREKMQVEVMLGRNYEWIQFESCELITANFFAKPNEGQNAKDIWENLQFNQMLEESGKLFKCNSTDSSFKVELQADNDHTVFRLVFRPIVVAKREVVMNVINYGANLGYSTPSLRIQS